jgi:hypothetical protein
MHRIYGTLLNMETKLTSFRLPDDILQALDFLAENGRNGNRTATICELVKAQASKEGRQTLRELMAELQPIPVPVPEEGPVRDRPGTYQGPKWDRDRGEPTVDDLAAMVARKKREVKIDDSE